MSDTGKSSERLALPSVPEVEALAALDDDGLLEAMAAYERAVAVLAGLSSVAAGLVAQRRHEQALVEVGRDASAGTVARVAHEAEAAVVDEIRLACGLGLFDAVARVRLGRASAARAGHVRGRLAQGACTWAMARAWQEATTDLPAEVADGIATVVLGPTRDGAALSMALFRQRLGRQIAKHRTARQRRDFDLSRRDASALSVKSFLPLAGGPFRAENGSPGACLTSFHPGHRRPLSSRSCPWRVARSGLKMVLRVPV